MDQDPECIIQFAGKELMVEAYGFALTKGSKWTKPISEQIRKYRDKGVIDELKKKWLSSKCDKINSESPGLIHQFDFIYLSGAFVLLVIGTLLSLFFFSIEHVIQRGTDRCTNVYILD